MLSDDSDGEWDHYRAVNVSVSPEGPDYFRNGFVATLVYASSDSESDWSACKAEPVDIVHQAASSVLDSMEGENDSSGQLETDAPRKSHGRPSVADRLLGGIAAASRVVVDRSAVIHDAVVSRLPDRSQLLRLSPT